MKKQFLILGFLLAVTTIGIMGCKKKKDEPAPIPAPIAAFSFTGAGANAPANVAFTNSSQNATSYSWDLGDGGTSTDVNPTHTYTVAGTYNVKLTATGTGGTNSITKSLTINAPTVMPVANFTYTGAGVNAPATVTFTNTSQNATTYSWDFGDNGTSTATSPSHLYTSGGTFTVTLIATNSNGSNTIQKTVNMLGPVAPIANFTYTGANGYAPATVTFTNTSQNATSYSWNFGDGGTSTATSPSHIFTIGGTFTVQLTATGTGGSNSTSQTVNILNPPIKVRIDQLKLWDYPQVDGSGSNWDYSAGPDIYWVIMNEAMTTTYFTSGTVTDAVYGNLPFTYTNGLPYTITSLTQTFTILFYDADSPDDDDFMDGYSFTPSDFSDYSSTLSFWSATSDLDFDLYVTWLNAKNMSNQSNLGKSRVELKPIDRKLILFKN